MMKSSFRDLIAWQKGMDLVDRIAEKVLTFPAYERWALADQMRRAAYSITLNIAEGSGGSLLEFRKFLRKARTSGYELESALESARRRGYLSDGEELSLRNDTIEVIRLVSGLIRNLTTRIRESEAKYLRGRRTELRTPNSEP